MELSNVLTCLVLLGLIVWLPSILLAASLKIDPAPVPISRPEYLKEKQGAIQANNAALIQSLEARARFTQELHPNLWRTL